MRFILEMYSNVSKSKVYDNLIGPTNHEHRESGVVFPASHFFNVLVQILADHLLRFPCLAILLQAIRNSEPCEP